MTQRMLIILTAGAVAAVACGGAWPSPSHAWADMPPAPTQSEASCADAAGALQALRPRLEQLVPSVDVISTEAPRLTDNTLQAMRTGQWNGERPSADLIANFKRQAAGRSAAACLKPFLPAGVREVDPAVVSEQLALFAKEPDVKFAATAFGYPVFSSSRDRAVVLVSRMVRGGIGSNTVLLLLAKRDGKWRETGGVVVAVA